MSLQEKFQITVPGKDEDGEGWVSAKSQRRTGEAGFAHSNNTSSAGDAFAKFNFMPPGMDISNQRRKLMNPMPLSMAGYTDVSKDVTDKAFDAGYTRREMQGTDDQYTGEHMDHFYGEAVDEKGNVGFVERNNYLDRE